MANIAARKRWTFTVGLVVFPTILVLLGLELGLRVFIGKYAYAAESDYQLSNERIWARNPNSGYQRKHPDTGARHWVYHNNWALRQHRDFSRAQLEGAFNVGVFGDSFVENLRIAAPFSFSESLDYLLNQTGQPAHVLNFGVDGYGTDQCYLHYQQFPHADQLDRVYYVFTGNDIRNIYENNLFYLNARGELTQREPEPSPWWVRALTHLHLTYFVIEAVERLAFASEDANKAIDLNAFLNHATNYKSAASSTIQRDYVASHSNPELERVMAVFWAILHRWQQAVEANGGSFHIVLLPREAESRLVEFPEAQAFSIVPLAPYFKQACKRLNHHQWRFFNDGHWNEFGNGLTAAHLWQHIHAARYSDNPVSQEEVDALLGTFYATFSHHWPGAPPKAPIQVALRTTYQQFETQH